MTIPKQHKVSLQILMSVFTSVTLVSACAPPSHQSQPIGEAKPTELMLKMRACAQGKLSSGVAVTAPEIGVCRKVTDSKAETHGKVVPTAISPSYYAGSKKGRIRIVQVAATQLGYADGVNLDTRARLQSEAVVNEFLTKTCVPMMKNVMKRSNIRARFFFRSFQANDRLMTKSDNLPMDELNLFEDSTVFTPVTDASPAPTAPEKDGEKKSPAPAQNASQEPQKLDEKVGRIAAPEQTRERRPLAETEYAARLAAIPPNMILELTLGTDQGITIKDHPNAISSGPLKAENAKAQHEMFCGQLMTYMGEYLGLGGLAKGQTCESKAPTVTATVEKTKATADSVGLMKSAFNEKTDYSKLSLAPSEVTEILTPACGP